MLKLVHTKVSTKADGTDPTLIQPSDWNAQHDLEMDSGNIIGRESAGQGGFEELGLGPNLLLQGGNLILNPNPRFSGNAGLGLPAGPGASRDPAPAAGEMRFNTDTAYAEYFDGAIWQSIGGQFYKTQGADIPSGGTLDLQDTNGELVNVTGNVTISTIVLNQGEMRAVRFLGYAAILHQGGNIWLPGQHPFYTNPGDIIVFRGYQGGEILAESVTKANGDAPAAPAAIEFVIDGGGAAIVAGVKGDIELPFGFLLNQVTMLADRVGTLQLDVYGCTYSAFDGGASHPTPGDSVTGGNYPTISGGTKMQMAPSSWVVSYPPGYLLRFYVGTAATIQRCTISLRGYRL